MTIRSCTIITSDGRTCWPDTDGILLDGVIRDLPCSDMGCSFGQEASSVNATGKS